MNTKLFEELKAAGLISPASLEKTQFDLKNRLFSLHWELRTMLYLGVLLLSGGLGILVYKNIDTIGHTAILIFICLVWAGGFYYCSKKKLPFSFLKVAAPNSFFDYILLLSCISFIIFIGYWQYQYHVFGERFGLVTFIPMLVLFVSAYFFDHLGVLSMAITNLAAWAGIAITPLQILKVNDFNSESIIFTGIALGVGLIALGYVTRLRNIKSHFEFTYTNFGMHLLFIATLAAIFHFDKLYAVWFVVLAGIAFYFYKEAIRSKSFYILLMLTLYSYIGLSYVIINFIFSTLHADMGGIYLSLLYFIITGLGLIMFLISMNKKLKAI